MRELSLFSGAGGGLLGTKLLGWKHCGYVEYNDYCQRVIAKRIKDGILDEAPIFGDIRTFLSEGYAGAYQGMVDVVTSGFPCQPFSVAGKGLGEDDPRNMWPQTIGVIRQVRPRFALLENVPGLLAHPYFGTILGDLAETGFHVKWTVLGCGALGGVTKRERLWLVGGCDFIDVERFNLHTRSSLEKYFRRTEPQGDIPYVETSWIMANGYGSRTHDEVAEILEPLKAIGNGQVPAVVKAVWRLMGPQ